MACCCSLQQMQVGVHSVQQLAAPPRRQMQQCWSPGPYCALAQWLYELLVEAFVHMLQQSCSSCSAFTCGNIFRLVGRSKLCIKMSLKINGNVVVDP